MDNPELSRRDFLKISGAAAAWMLVRPFEVLAKPSEHVTFPQIRDFALRMDRMFDILPDLHIDFTMDTIDNWMQEVIPHYQSEGFIDEAIYPTDIEFYSFTGKDERGQEQDPLNTEMSTSVCKSTVKVSARLKNPMSAWYNSSDELWALVHEWAHVQQKLDCHIGWMVGVKMEESAQVGAMEVLAAMGLEGNAYAIFSLVDMLEELSMNSAHFLALQDKKFMRQYQWLEKTVYAKPTEQARIASVQNFVRGNEDNYQNFLEIYNYAPLDTMLMALNGDGVAHNLEFPNRNVRMDDMAYFLSSNHMEGLIRQLTAK